MFLFHALMGYVLWAWCFACLLFLGSPASAQTAGPGMVVPICVLVPGVPEDVARTGFAFAPNATTVIRMRREEFEKESRGQLVYVYNPTAPPGNIKLLPIRYHHLTCAPYVPPTSAPVVPSAPPKAGSPPPPPPPTGGTTKGTAPKPAKKKPATPKAGEAPSPLPQPIIYPKNEPEPKPRPPRHGITTHWQATVLPVVRRPTDTRTTVLPTTTVLPFKDPSVAPATKTLPVATVLPSKEPTGGGGEGSSTDSNAPNKVAKKSSLDKVAEELAYAGAIANLQLGEDTKRPDGKQYGIPGGTNANGPNHPVVQAGAGAVLVVAAVLSAGGNNFRKKLIDALKKKTPLVVTETMLTKEAAEEVAERFGAYAADALNKNGAIGPYSLMKRFTDKLGGRWQAHHILEKSMAKKFGLGNPDKVPSVILTDAQHKLLTAELAAKTASAKTAQELWKAYQKVYKDYPPHWLEAIKSYFVKAK